MQKNGINLFIQPLSYFDFDWITIELTRAISCWSVCILYPFGKTGNLHLEDHFKWKIKWTLFSSTFVS